MQKCASDCTICYRPGNTNCRTCKQVVCRACLEEWQAACYSKNKKTNCPSCRTVWETPNFFIEAPGDFAGHTVTLYFKSSIHKGPAYQVVPIYTDKVVGMAVIRPSLITSEFSLHMDHIKQIEPFAANLKWLFQDLEHDECIFSSTLPEPHIADQFEKAGVDIAKISVGGYTVYKSNNLADFFKAAQTLQINFF